MLPENRNIIRPIGKIFKFTCNGLANHHFKTASIKDVTARMMMTADDRVAMLEHKITSAAYIQKTKIQFEQHS